MFSTSTLCAKMKPARAKTGLDLVREVLTVDEIKLFSEKVLKYSDIELN